LQWATGTACDAVAFTDGSTRLEDGWRAALGLAIDSGADVVGGPVLPAWITGDRDRTSWAGFLAEYAPHAVPPYTSATGDLSANNVGYRLSTVLGFSGQPFWKSVVDRDLAARGHQLEVAEHMRAVSLRRYSMRDITVRRAAAGRLYGAQLARTLTIRGRLVRIAACALLPFVRVVRIMRTVRGDLTLERQARRAFVHLLVAESAWSLGEALGCADPSHPPAGVR
jgi:hypothetical protein